jgi:hypothetical protein
MGGGQGGAAEEMSGIDRQRVLAELSPTWLAGLAGEDLKEGRRLLEAVVDDWAAEADPTPNPETTLRFQREDLEALGADRDPAGRLAALRRRVLGRQVDSLSIRSYELGRAVKAGTVEDEQAQREGRHMLGEAAALAAELRELPADSDLEPLRRERQEAMLDALYAVERKAMSGRLARS